MAKIKIAELAKRLNKTSLEIASETGLNRNTIGTLLRGDASDIRLSTIQKICETYNLPLEEIIEIEHAKAKPASAEAYPAKVYKQEAEGVPFTFWPWSIVSGTCTLTHKGRTYDLKTMYAYCKGDYAEVYWDHDALHAYANAFYELYADKPAFDRLYQKYLSYSAEIEELYGHMAETRGATPTTSNILELLGKIRREYQGFWETGLFIDTFDTGLDQEKIAGISASHGFSKEEMQVLTTPTELTFADERKYALLSLIKGLVTGRKKGSVDEFMKRHATAIEQYREKFDYYKSNYAYIKHITLNEIHDEIEEYVTNPVLFKENFERLDSYMASKEKQVARILRAHNLKKNPLRFFQSITYWREHRKKLNLMGFHVLDQIMLGIEKITGVPYKNLQYLTFDEVENVLKGLIPSAMLEKRRILGTLFTVTGNHYKLYEGKEAASIRNDLESILSGKTDKTVITGQTASQGFAKGIARIILTQKDFARFKEGDVLVASMTRPEYVPLMKIAAGIVTNEGGITCHAAIVSRELGKPCIIGTKIATQVIQEGDLVEVRANHGTVRILEHGKRGV